ncbi:hypothetical protein RHMOL_Rhmol10G0018400 [Rhododendron molle]|uniref:Uncharacterized protein n=1 Tax=Rhododendron molle TaxID=49168 RepID=A0ACC0LXR0_RHOML|nr:hypothetical protein RHMOL_Rhmol10G0018400 [Rhododendron molle]
MSTPSKIASPRPSALPSPPSSPPPPDPDSCALVVVSPDQSVVVSTLPRTSGNDGSASGSSATAGLEPGVT